MAEFIMKDLVKREQKAQLFHIESAATSDEEIWNGVGSPVYPNAKRELRKHGLNCEGKRARQIAPEDYNRFDYLIGMENANIRNMRIIFRNDPEHKISRLLDYTDSPGDIDDPWFTGDFSGVYKQILRGCRALYESVMNFHVNHF